MGNFNEITELIEKKKKKNYKRRRRRRRITEEEEEELGRDVQWGILMKLQN
jgi:hypothetical protein